MTDQAAMTVDDRGWGLHPGDEIDASLVVLEPLGGGDRYEVFRAWDRELFCQVAVKVVRPDRVRHDRTITALDREAATAARLSHPNLVRFLRRRIDGERPYLVLELISAQTVADHLRDIGPVSVPEMCLLGIRMLSALHYMHGQHVLHLDVKPSNLTMGAPPRLLDLSIARPFAGPLRLRDPIGTAAYMAPEQCLPGEDVTPSADVFGLAATMYEALTGMQPFSDGAEKGASAEERYPQLVEEPLPLEDALGAVPRGLSQVLTAALGRNAARRPGTLDAAVALQGVLEELGLSELYAWPKGTQVRPRS